eukprot:GHVP01061432.1.p1 GENE.GHVP01061432.1~~GHVP01061432.1.p1  ORF type:complete len:1551 (+),score=263.97 GHVP01061432.1:469-5121(+)
MYPNYGGNFKKGVDIFSNQWNDQDDYFTYPPRDKKSLYGSKKGIFLKVKTNHGNPQRPCELFRFFSRFGTVCDVVPVPGKKEFYNVKFFSHTCAYLAEEKCNKEYKNRFFSVRVENAKTGATPYIGISGHGLHFATRSGHNKLNVFSKLSNLDSIMPEDTKYLRYPQQTVGVVLQADKGRQREMFIFVRIKDTRFKILIPAWHLKALGIRPCLYAHEHYFLVIELRLPPKIFRQAWPSDDSNDVLWEDINAEYTREDISLNKTVWIRSAPPFEPTERQKRAPEYAFAHLGTASTLLLELSTTDEVQKLHSSLAKFRFFQYRDNHDRQNIKNIEIYDCSDNIEKLQKEARSILTSVREMRGFPLCMTFVSLLTRGIFHWIHIPKVKAFLLNKELSDSEFRAIMEELLGTTESLIPLFDPLRSLERTWHYLKRKGVYKYNDAPQRRYAWIFHVEKSPLRTIIIGPITEKNNRVLRNFPNEIFLRFSFIDDDGRDLFINKKDTCSIAFTVREFLEKGFSFFSQNRFEFFTCSANQMKDRKGWLFSVSNESATDAAAIRKKYLNHMGDFSKIKNIGKLSARHGQCFSTTDDSFDLVEDQYIVEDDITYPVSEDSHCVFTFTDGIGYCSMQLLEKVVKALNLEVTPSSVQIRFGGMKGMLILQPRFSEIPKVKEHGGSLLAVFRKSMNKFESKSCNLEICGYSRFLEYTLNRQIILTLSTKGVPNLPFLQLQEEAVHELKVSRSNASAANFLLKTSKSLSHSMLIKTLIHSGLLIRQELFLKRALLAIQRWRWRKMQSNANIPIDDGAILYGVSDETWSLQYDNGEGLPEVFIQIRKEGEPPQVIEGIVALAKCPVHHPGDIQLCEAVDHHELRQLFDVVVFPMYPKDNRELHRKHPGFQPQHCYTGYRDIPNMLSGGDLDGDQFHALWDEKLVKPLYEQFLKANEDMELFSPADYYVPTNYKIPREDLADEKKALINFFIRHAKNDELGRLSTAHIIMAHQKEIYQKKKAAAPICIEIAQKCSEAVDFQKHGKAARMEDRYQCKSRPHFMFTEEMRRLQYFKSDSILGQLYDAITSTSLNMPFLRTTGPSPTQLRVEIKKHFWDTDFEEHRLLLDFNWKISFAAVENIESTRIMTQSAMDIEGENPLKQYDEGVEFDVVDSKTNYFTVTYLPDTKAPKIRFAVGFVPDYPLEWSPWLLLNDNLTSERLSGQEIEDLYVNNDVIKPVFLVGNGRVVDIHNFISHTIKFLKSFVDVRDDIIASLEPFVQVQNESEEKCRMFAVHFNNEYETRATIREIASTVEKKENEGNPLVLIFNSENFTFTTKEPKTYVTEAVDFTNVPLPTPNWPDFLAPLSDSWPFPLVDPDLLAKGFQEHSEAAEVLDKKWSEAIEKILRQYRIDDEVALILGCFVGAKNNGVRKERDLTEKIEAALQHEIIVISSLAFAENPNDVSNTNVPKLEDENSREARASAVYFETYRKLDFEHHLGKRRCDEKISLPWMAFADQLISLKKRATWWRSENNEEAISSFHVLAKHHQKCETVDLFFNEQFHVFDDE